MIYNLPIIQPFIDPYRLLGGRDIVHAQNGRTLLQGIELQSLRSGETGLRRQTQRTVHHGLTAHAHQYRPIKGLQAAHLMHAGIIRFGAADESESGVKDQIDICQIGSFRRQGKVAA